MSLVNVANMAVLDNPAPYTNPLQFEITFECLEGLEDDLEWKVIYVGSANNTQNDQILDEILVGPVPIGINKFILQTDPPNHTTIPSSDILGVTVLLVTCSYRDKEFLRVGYYVNNEYTEEYDVEKGPPEPLEITKVVRTILADKPRVTRFPIHWGADADATEEQGNVSGNGNGASNGSANGNVETSTPVSPDGGVTQPQGQAPGEGEAEPEDDILMDEDMNEDDEEEEEEDENENKDMEEDISLELDEGEGEEDGVDVGQMGAPASTPIGMDGEGSVPVEAAMITTE